MPRIARICLHAPQITRASDRPIPALMVHQPIRLWLYNRYNLLTPPLVLCCSLFRLGSSASTTRSRDDHWLWPGVSEIQQKIKTILCTVWVNWEDCSRLTGALRKSASPLLLRWDRDELQARSNKVSIERWRAWRSSAPVHRCLWTSFSLELSVICWSFFPSSWEETATASAAPWEVQSFPHCGSWLLHKALKHEIQCDSVPRVV